MSLSHHLKFAHWNTRSDPTSFKPVRKGISFKQTYPFGFPLLVISSLLESHQVFACIWSPGLIGFKTRRSNFTLWKGNSFKERTLKEQRLKGMGRGRVKRAVLEDCRSERVESKLSWLFLLNPESKALFVVREPRVVATKWRECFSRESDLEDFTSNRQFFCSILRRLLVLRMKLLRASKITLGKLLSVNQGVLSASERTLSSEWRKGFGLLKLFFIPDHSILRCSGLKQVWELILPTSKAILRIGGSELSMNWMKTSPPSSERGLGVGSELSQKKVVAITLEPVSRKRTQILSSKSNTRQTMLSPKNVVWITVRTFELTEVCSLSSLPVSYFSWTFTLFLDQTETIHSRISG